MTGEDFQSFWRHFIKHTRVIKERPVLLLLDNHQSHLDLPSLDWAKKKEQEWLFCLSKLYISKNCNSDKNHDDNSSEELMKLKAYWYIPTTSRASALVLERHRFETSMSACMVYVNSVMGRKSSSWCGVEAWKRGLSTDVLTSLFDNSSE
ncbi:hypothetical protein AVEN_235358-1 [Araneus ventricosus]|uniref:DDE-1 domain-containing protein n=1 Tax=Araneus ventricosus TaxID=182803 RepID=A0A4Y2A3G3_ARAVE|nr:hypothetical protein AVEN_235358-1 [Araneus ventricosus]